MYLQFTYTHAHFIFPAQDHQHQLLTNSSKKRRYSLRRTLRQRSHSKQLFCKLHAPNTCADFTTSLALCIGPFVNEPGVEGVSSPCRVDNFFNFESRDVDTTDPFPYISSGTEINAPISPC